MSVNNFIRIDINNPPMKSDHPRLATRKGALGEGGGRRVTITVKGLVLDLSIMTLDASPQPPPPPHPSTTHSATTQLQHVSVKFRFAELVEDIL